MGLFLGIDTSCYTTSLAVVDSEGNLLSEARKILSVNAGSRGLAQNEAVFQHIGNLSGLFAELSGSLGFSDLLGVAASTRPRPQEGSYMPVFTVAESYGRSLASLWRVPFVPTTHQEGHLAAGVWSARGPKAKEFLAVHLSGGTTELLRVSKHATVPYKDRNPAGAKPDETAAGPQQFDIEILGGTTDLHAGQFVDRVGVILGLSFPAGPELERLAQKAPADSVSIPSSVKGYHLSFSGPEAAASRLAAQNCPAADIARAVEKCIAATLEKLIRRAAADTGLADVLVVGGVSANRYIRERLQLKLGQNAGTRLHFAAPGLSSDNAVGVALIGMETIGK